MNEMVDISNTMDEEENERKLLADTSDEEVNETNEKVDENKVFGSNFGVILNQYKYSNKSEDESSNNSNDEQDEANEKEVNLFEKKLAKNPYDYEAHKLLITKLHKMGDLKRLRIARENMSSKYPLTPELWLLWLQDEMKLAVTQEEKYAVIEIYERATSDYLSVDIWLEYLQFNIGLGSNKETIEKIRILFERALTAAGLHVMKGVLIWDAFREFESFIEVTMDSFNFEKKNQINRIGKLYRRQLACPLFGMDKTYEEYKKWSCIQGYEYVDKEILKSEYEKTVIELNARLPFEEKLESAENKSELFDIYKAYLIHEKQIGDPGRVTVLYERALTDVSLESVLWIDYLQFIENNIKINDIIERIYIRAVRNVPWCVSIWQKWIRFYEKINAPLTDIQKLVENAFTVGFSNCDEYKNLWLTYLEYLRRRVVYKSENETKQLEILRETFNRAHNYLSTFGLEGDPTCEILQFWARFEAIHANDMEKARWVWADIMSQGHSESAASWLEYISLEKCYGDAKHIRKLFQKALIAVKDWPESIANAWINFERDEGTLDQIENCELKIQEQLKKIYSERQEFQLPSVSHTKIANKRKGKKRGDDQIWKDIEDSKFKMSKFEKSDHKIISKEKMEENSYNLQKVDDKITIFISNLDYATTEEEIEKVLKPVGSITYIRMIKDYKGRSKGYCYVQLCNPQAVEEALKLDRTRINSRPIFISRCDPNKTSRASGFKYKTELETNKLFVKGLPFTITKEQLHEVFKIHGKLKDVRIVTYRNGHSKGLAYIDFEDENSAKKALAATDGMIIEEKTISVAMSQPPQRKQISNNDNIFSIKSLGGSSTSRTFGNPKTVLSLIPRTVKKSVTNNQSFDNEIGRSMNNADFKNLFFNKK